MSHCSTGLFFQRVVNTFLYSCSLLMKRTQCDAAVQRRQSPASAAKRLLLPLFDRPTSSDLLAAKIIGHSMSEAETPPPLRFRSGWTFGLNEQNCNNLCSFKFRRHQQFPSSPPFSFLSFSFSFYLLSLSYCSLLN